MSFCYRLTRRFLETSQNVYKWPVIKLESYLFRYARYGEVFGGTSAGSRGRGRAALINISGAESASCTEPPPPRRPPPPSRRSTPGSSTSITYSRMVYDTLRTIHVARTPYWSPLILTLVDSPLRHSLLFWHCTANIFRSGPSVRRRQSRSPMRPRRIPGCARARTIDVSSATSGELISISHFIATPHSFKEILW